MIPNNDSSASIFEMFINEMYNQLCNKLAKQDEHLLKETNKNSPLFIQRKQLQKDIDDFQMLNKRQDVHAIQLIIERVEHMAMFNKKLDIGGVLSNMQMNKQVQSIMEPSIKLNSISCSYRVC